jgi:hypothetical protein
MLLDPLHCYKKFIHAVGDHHRPRKNTRPPRTMSFVFSRSTKKILGMQRQARWAVFIAVRLFDTDKKATKLNRARIFTESLVCFST